MTTKLITSRKWTSPAIEAFINSEEVGARLDLTAFLDAIVEEVGNPTMLVTKAALRARLEAASEAVLHELRATTKYVV
jgi:hypothetical protein